MNNLFLKLLLAVFLFLCVVPVYADSLKQYAAKIKTKSGSVVWNVVVRAHDPFEAAYKINIRYKGATIIRLKEK